MTVLQNIIKKIKEYTSEMKFKASLKKYIQSYKDSIATAENNFSKAVEEGDAEEAFYQYQRIDGLKASLQRRIDFEKYMLSSAA